MNENDNQNKKSIHIHTGGLIILIILILILFRVDIKSKITSPQFQKNITYIEDQSKHIWQTYILNPIKKSTGSIFNDFADQGVKELKESVNKRLDTSLNEDRQTLR